MNNAPPPIIRAGYATGQMYILPERIAAGNCLKSEVMFLEGQTYKRGGCPLHCVKILRH